MACCLHKTRLAEERLGRAGKDLVEASWTKAGPMTQQAKVKAAKRKAKENLCKGCGYPIAPWCIYCGECLCEEDSAP